MSSSVATNDKIDYLLNTKNSKFIYTVLIKNKQRQLKKIREFQKQYILNQRKVRIEKSKQRNMLLLYSGMMLYGF